MMVEFEPPLVACVVSRADYSFAAMLAARQCVIAIPAVELASVVVKVGDSSGCTVDKLRKDSASRRLPGERVAAPLIAECFANLECKVVDTSLVEKYDTFVLEVVKAWNIPGQGRPRTLHHHGHGRVRGGRRNLVLPSRMP